MKKRHSRQLTSQPSRKPNQPATPQSAQRPAQRPAPQAASQPAEEKDSKHTGIGTIIHYVFTGLILVLLATVYFLYRDNEQKKLRIFTFQQAYMQSEKKQEELNAYIEEITDTINSVESKLQDVRSRQVSITGMISLSEKGGTKKTRLLQDISIIEDQLKVDKQQIADLQDKMKKSAIRFKLLDDWVANLKTEIERNEKTTAELRELVEAKDRVIMEKERVIVEKEEVIRSKEDSLDYANENLRRVTGELEQTSQLLDETKNTAYYVAGSKKFLLAQNVLRETGGFMHKKLNISGSFDKSAFTKIHIARESEFPVRCRAKEVQLLPAREAGSFTLEPAGKDACLLKVVNPEQFWKMPYLVILMK